MYRVTLKLKAHIQAGSCRRLWRWAVLALLAMRVDTVLIFETGILIVMH